MSTSTDLLPHAWLWLRHALPVCREACLLHTPAHFICELLALREGEGLGGPAWQVGSTEGSNLSGRQALEHPTAVFSVDLSVMLPEK
eukprot:1106880-Pelagomonas_calceolata.AAC.1